MNRREISVTTAVDVEKRTMELRGLYQGRVVYKVGRDGDGWHLRFSANCEDLAAERRKNRVASEVFKVLDAAEACYHVAEQSGALTQMANWLHDNPDDLSIPVV